MRGKDEVQISIRGPEPNVLATITRLCRAFQILDVTDTYPGRFCGEYVAFVTVGMRPARQSAGGDHGRNQPA